MKYTTLIFILLFLFTLSAHAQNTTVCAVKYKDSDHNLSTINYWFYKDKYVYIMERNLKGQFLNGFPVLINKVMTTQTDTIKYNKEFNDLIKDLTAQNSNEPEDLWTKQYNTNIENSARYLPGFKKYYMLVDTVPIMTNWKILDDTLTILGFKCQKAKITKDKIEYIAWFTTQLPYNAGPDNFNGLPGLILKLIYPHRKMSVDAVEILTPFKGIVPKMKEDITLVTQKEWVALVDESNKKSKEAHDNYIKQLVKDIETKKN